MRFFRRIAGLLGLGKDDGHEKDEDDDANHNNNSDGIHRDRVFVDPIPGPRNGFGVPVQVAVDRPAMGPVLISCNGDGGVQGLRWYAKRMRIDEDGDVADEFVHEVLAEMSPVLQDEQKAYPRFQVKNNTRHAKVRNQVMSSEGKLLQCVDYQGRLQWI